MLSFELSEKLLGEGMFGKVYKGYRKSTGEVVAIKVTAKKLLAKSAKKKSQLDKEIAFMKEIRHPNIVRLIDTELTTTSIHMVLEYCPGGDLAHRLSSSPGRKLSETVARRYLRHLAAGLHCIWQSNLIHRDLKPQNLLLSTNNDSTAVLKIADFGFARQLGMGTLAETQCGSPLYMAPEILNGRHYDAKCDLWSVGVILFQMVTGEPPYKGRDTPDLRNNIRTKPVVIPKGVKISTTCKALLKRLLVRNPLQRCSYEEFFESEFLQASDGSGSNHRAFRLDSSVLPGSMKGLEPIAEGISPPQSLQEQGGDNANASGAQKKFSSHLPASPSSRSYRQKLEDFNNATKTSGSRSTGRPRGYRRSQSDPVQLQIYATQIAKTQNPSGAQGQPSPPLRTQSARQMLPSPQLPSETPPHPVLRKSGSRSLPNSPHQNLWPSPLGGTRAPPPSLPPDYTLPSQAIAADVASVEEPSGTAVQPGPSVPSPQPPHSISEMLGVLPSGLAVGAGGVSGSAAANQSPAGSTDWELVDSEPANAFAPRNSASLAGVGEGKLAGGAGASAGFGGRGTVGEGEALPQRMVPPPGDDPQVVELVRSCGQQILSLVALADAKAANALSRESEASYLSQILCRVEPDDALEGGASKCGENTIGQLYMECLVLYLNALGLVRNAMNEATSICGNSRPEVIQWLRDLYDSILSRAKECRERLNKEEHTGSMQTSVLHILLHSSQTLARTAVVKDLLGQDVESQQRYDQARVLMEVFCSQQKLSENRKFSFKNYVDLMQTRTAGTQII